MKIFKDSVFWICVTTLFALGAFVFRYSLPMADATSSFFNQPDSIAAFLAAYANQITILVIVVAVMSFWGYNHIKTAAENKAVEHLTKILPPLIEKMIREFSPEQLEKIIFEKSNSKATVDMNEVISGMDEN